MEYNSLFEYTMYIDNTDFRDITRLYSNLEITKEDKLSILSMLNEKNFSFSEDRFITNIGVFSQRDLINLYKLDMVSSKNQDIDLTKTILKKQEGVFIFDFYPFIESGDFRLSDYKELLRQRENLTSAVTKSELPFLFMLETSNDTEELELITFIENFYKRGNQPLGADYFEVPSISYFLNDRFYNRFMHILNKNRNQISLLYSVKSIYNLQTRKCFHSKYPNKVTVNEYNILMTRIKNILEIYNSCINFRDFEQMPLNILYNALIKNAQDYLFPTHFNENSESDFLKYLRVPLSNFINDHYELVYRKEFDRKVLETNETIDILLRTSYLNYKGSLKEYLNQFKGTELNFIVEHEVLN